MNMQKALVKTVGLAAMLAVNVIRVADASAQQPAPIHGVTGTIATDTSIQETSAAGGKIVGKVKRILHLNGQPTVPGGDAAGAEALGGLKKGTRVVVRYAADGANPTAEAIDRKAREGLKEMAGSVVALNLADRTISVRLSDDSIQTLRLSDEAAADARNIDRAADAGANVIVYYRNESGQRIAKYFKRVS
jgi:hypothetical protein